MPRPPDLRAIALVLAVAATAVVGWLHYGAGVPAARIAALVALLGAGVAAKHWLRTRARTRPGLGPGPRRALEFGLDLALFAVVVLLLMPR
jgi:hypothetical protein